LDHKIADVQDIIVELNLFVKAQQDALTTMGERTKDLLVNLFTAYMTCSDTEFLAWTRSREDKYNEGKITLSPEELMTLADNKYNSLVESGKWMQASEDQKKNVALTAQVQSWEKVKAKPGSNRTSRRATTKRARRVKAKVTTSPSLRNPPGSRWPLVLDNLKTRMLTERTGIGASTMANMASGFVILARSVRSRKPLKARLSDLVLVATTSLAR
jgi:hypothetical protein